MTTKIFSVIPRNMDAALANGRPDPTLIRPVTVNFPTANADDEWRFGLATWSLTGIANRKLITLNGDPPAFDRATMTLAAGNFMGVITPYPEATAETVLLVIRNVALSGVIAGTMSADTSDGGFSIHRNGGNVLTFVTRGITAGDGSSGTQRSDFTVGGVVPDGQAFFVAVSHSSTTRLAYVGGIGSQTRTGTRVISTGPRNISLGNVWYTSGFSQQTQICAFAYIPATTVTSDLDAYYANAKSFMPLRGINVF